MDVVDATLVAVLPFLAVLALLLVLARTERFRVALAKREEPWVYLLAALGPFLSFLAMLLLLSNSTAGTTERRLTVVVAAISLGISLFGVARWALARRG